MPDNNQNSSHTTNSRKARTPGRAAASRLRRIIPAVMLAVLVFIMVILTFQSLPQNGDQVSAWSAKTGNGEKGPEPPGYEKVLDDTRILRKPYFALLKKAKEKTAKELYEEAKADFDFNDLAANPQKYRGALLRVEGQVIDVRAVIPEPDPSEQEGVPAGEAESIGLVYQTEIVKLANGGVAEKYFLHTEDFPQHLSPGDEIRLAGFFYNRYKGKEVELKEGGRATVVAPLLVGRRVEHVSKEEYAPDIVRVNLPGELRDRAEISRDDEEAILAAVEALKSVDGTSDISYFDMNVDPDDRFRGCVVRVSGEVSRIERLEGEDVPEALKGYRRIVLTINKDTPFVRYAAACVSPDVGEIQQMQVVTLRGVFIKSARLEGGRDRTVDMPLIASAEAESIAWPETEEMNPWLRTLLVGAIIIAAVAMCAAALIFYMTHRDKRKRFERRKTLQDIRDKHEKQG